MVRQTALDEKGIIRAMNKVFLGLLIFVPVTAVAYALHANGAAIFFLSALAIIPLAKFIGEATEHLAARSGAAVGGFLNATFGNATELIIGLFALRAGLPEVVKASLTGSILGNLLLVLGMAMAIGGARRPFQKFNKTAALAASSALLLAVIALVMPAIFVKTASAAAGATEDISIFVSCVLLIVYGAGLWFSLNTHKHLYATDANAEAELESTWSTSRSLLVLVAATGAVAWVSDILVGSIQPLIGRLGWSELFVGVVLIAIIGNAAEHTSAIVAAIKDKMDLALQISIGSATQVAMFVAPALVLASIFFGTPMNLIFNTFELASVAFAVIIVGAVVQDGQSNWLEGVQLLSAYAIMAVAFFFHP
jgi:Ca2+:H+ antiporter